MNTKNSSMSKVQKRPPMPKQVLGLPGPPKPKRKLKAQSKRFSKPQTRTIRANATRTDSAWTRFMANNTRHDIIEQLDRLRPDVVAFGEPRGQEYNDGYFQGVMDALSLTRSQSRAIIDPKVDEAPDVKMIIKQEIDDEDDDIPEDGVVSGVKFKPDPPIKLETNYEDIGEISGDGVVPAVSFKLEPANYAEDDITVQEQIKNKVLPDESGSVRYGVLSRLGKWFWYT